MRQATLIALAVSGVYAPAEGNQSSGGGGGGQQNQQQQGQQGGQQQQGGQNQKGLNLHQANLDMNAIQAVEQSLLDNLKRFAPTEAERQFCSQIYTQLVNQNKRGNNGLGIVAFFGECIYNGAVDGDWVWSGKYAPTQEGMMPIQHSQQQKAVA